MNIKMNIKQTLVLLLLMIVAITVPVLAEENITDTQDSVLHESMTVRYEHLECKVAFTNGQIIVFDEYLSDDTGLLDYKESLEDYMDKLEDILNDDNRTLFDEYITNTLRPELVDATQALNNVKKNFRTYNLTNESRIDIKDSLKELKETYNECISDKTIKIANVYKKHYSNTDDRWGHIIENMDKFNISTEKLEEIKNMLNEQEELLEDAIDSGNQTLIKETLAQIREEHQHLWANFEISRMNGYLDKMGPMAEKYGMNDKVNNMRKQLGDLEKYTQQGHKYEAGEVKEVWQGLHDTSKDMKETSKEILKERVKDMREERKDMVNDGQGRGRK